MEAVTNEYDDIFQIWGTKRETKHEVLNFFPAFIVYFYSWGLFFCGGCTKILIFLLIFVIFMNMCEWPTGCTERAKVTHMDINTRAEFKQMTKKKKSRVYRLHLSSSWRPHPFILTHQEMGHTTQGFHWDGMGPVP